MPDKLFLWPEAPGALGTADEDKPHLLPFLLDTDKPRGLVIVCPGGGYVMRAPHEADPIAEMLNAHGYHAVVLHYRVAPYKHPRPLQDAQRAIRLVRSKAAEWHVDPQHIGMLGFSAGGHLTATASTHYDLGDPLSADPVERFSCRPDASVLCYAVVSFLPFSHSGSRSNLMGENPSLALITDLSNELRITSDTPPAFIWHCADDNGVHPENALRYASALGIHGIPYELHIYQKGGHGSGLGLDDPAMSTWGDLLGIWLGRNGF